MKALIVCNGNIDDYSYYNRIIDTSDIVICADGGANHLRKFGLKPNVLLGDFDSIKPEDLEYFKKSGVEVSKFPSEKDMTDTELAVTLAIDKGCNEICIIGGIGTRLDHSLANIFLLKKMHEMGVKGTIINEFNEATIIDDSIKLYREPGIKVTLIPLSEYVEGVTTKGLFYPLDNAKIPMGSTWGVSNEFNDDIAEVSVKKGLLLVIKSRD